MRRLSAGLTLLLTLCLAAPAAAATITVTTLDDTVAADGKCSLREAVTAANTGSAAGDCAAGTSGADTITLPGGTLTVATPLSVTGEVTISGQGIQDTRIVPGPDPGRFIEAGPNVIHLSKTSVSGFAAPPATTGDGPSGGAILAGGAVTLDHVSLTGNVAGAGAFGATDGGRGGDGGGISAGGDITITDSVIADNVGGEGGGGNNNGGNGGVGAMVSNADIAITRSIVVNNHGGRPGAGSVRGNGGTGVLVAIDDATLDEVSFADNARGLNNVSGTSPGPAPPVMADVAGDLTLTQITSTEGSAISTWAASTFTVRGSALNGPCTGATAVDEDNITGVSQPCLGTQVADFKVAKGPLTTDPVLPQPGSPLLNAYAGPCHATTDLRGASRPQGGACDVGAYEVIETPSVTPVAADFGSVTAGTSSVRRDFVVTPSDRWTAATVAVVGADPAAFPVAYNGCGDAFAIGQTCTVSLAFAPDTARAFAGRLRVTGTATPATLVTSELSGTGVAPAAPPTGATGAAGATGATGATGPAGTAGTNGINGTNGDADAALRKALKKVKVTCAFKKKGRRIVCKLTGLPKGAKRRYVMRVRRGHTSLNAAKTRVLQAAYRGRG